MTHASRGRHAAGSALLLALLGGCSGGVLDPHGPIGATQKTMLLNSLGIMLAVVVPTILATFAFAWWFRASNTRAHFRPKWTYSAQLEMVVWAIPAMVVMLLAGVVWVGTHALDPPRPIASATPPLAVEVVSLDWKWLFIYPQLGVASVNRLVVPAGTPVSFRITSATVMNSFFVPQLGSQIYAMAGMATRLHLLADRPGRYRGFSAQLSGEGFSDMQFVVDAKAPAEFAAWLATARAQPEILDFGRYSALAVPSQAVAPRDFGAVAPGLFETVLHLNDTSPAPGTPASAPASVRPRTVPTTATPPAGIRKDGA